MIDRHTPPGLVFSLGLLVGVILGAVLLGAVVFRLTPCEIRGDDGKPVLALCIKR